MVYIKWQCPECEDIVISNTKRRHQMDGCKCGKSAVDAEEGYTRVCGTTVNFLENYDYNFFDELVLCIKEQGFLENYNLDYLFNDKITLTLQEVIFIRDLEDEICENLKWQE